MFFEQLKARTPQLDERSVSKLPRALRFVMHDFRLRHTPNLPAGAFDAHTPIDLFAVNEKSLVKPTHLLGCPAGERGIYDFAAHQQVRAEWMIDLKRLAARVR